MRQIANAVVGKPKFLLLRREPKIQGKINNFISLYIYKRLQAPK